MKVYLVHVEMSYEFDDVIAAFLDKEKAEAYIKKFEGDLFGENLYLQEILITE